MNPLIIKIRAKEKPLLFYGFTPPKRNNDIVKNIEISQRRMVRLEETPIDGLVIYDIQDESSRQKDQRPFPFLPTLEPMEYYNQYLPGLDVPPVLYQCVGNYTKEELLQKIPKLKHSATVFVGSPSKNEDVKLSLKEAYDLSQHKGLTLGGVVIPERHGVKGDEHIRILNKQHRGCEFFISQCVFDSEKFKNMLASYYYHCKTHSMDLKPIVMTISPCGSMKTLELLRWLGISIPTWIELDILHGDNPLDNSLDLSKNLFKDIFNYAKDRGIPLGCNVESVSIRKDEVLASFELLKELRSLMFS